MVATRNGEKHDVIHCNYCQSGMSVPVSEIPDDPECQRCKQLRRRGTAEDRSQEIIRDSDVENGARVMYNGHEWRAEWFVWHDLLLKRWDSDDPTQHIIERPVDVRDVELIENVDDECGFVGGRTESEGDRNFEVAVQDAYRESGSWGASDSDTEDRLVTDGGEDIRDCPDCGADPVESAELGYSFAPKPGTFHPKGPHVKAPDADCGECGRPLGSAYGTGFVIDLFDALDEPMPGESQ